MKFYELGEVRPPCDEDFMYFKQMAQDDTHWKKKYGRKKIKVFTRSTETSNFKMIKVVATLSDVSADVLYDTLHDPIYRITWDKSMKEGHEICSVAQDSIIEYYGFRSPFAFKNRDFVLHRSWRIYGSEYIIFNRSVFHKKMPPQPGYIRALTLLTGYVITSTGPSSCEMIYITQNDPRGDIPAWAINLATTSLAPSIMKSLRDAASRYPAWKMEHDPRFMPWRHPSQQSGLLPMVDMADILSEPDYERTTIDETNVSEDAALKECARVEADVDL